MEGVVHVDPLHLADYPGQDGWRGTGVMLFVLNVKLIFL